jgi:catechol 2,3-dioxygenase-like lactoylglutathione lyase family enzyme
MRADAVTCNLPSRDFDATAGFYGRLGFEVAYRDEHWMILERGPLLLEFFPYPDLDPRSSSFGACVRVADVDGLHARWAEASLPSAGIPRCSGVTDAPWGMRTFHVVDPDGSLLRVMEPV